MYKKIISTLSIAIAAAAPMSVMAYEAGDILVRAGAAMVDPSSDGKNDVGVYVDDNTQLGLTVGYFFTDNVALELLLATPFTHDLKIDDAVVGETKQLPPTLNVQYYFNNASAFTPYIGAGLNYTVFFDEKVLDKNEELKNSFGLSVQAGLDYAINDSWGLNASVAYTEIETEVVGGAVDGTKVTLDPMVYMLSASYKF